MNKRKPLRLAPFAIDEPEIVETEVNSARGELELEGALKK